MKMQSFISIILVSWCSLGAALGPQFQCSCADGTQTIEFGNRFCCDDDAGVNQDACNDLCDDSENRSHDGCKSTPIQDEVFVSSDRGDEGQADPLSLTDQLHYAAFFAQPISPSPGGRIHLQLRCPQPTDLSQIRSVVLRV